ncbi:LysR family transcriptional regulator [Martelella alba]|uniref:LysR family transcriptional regulator n=1 Tax=Martelella alba TaxID=2590451 RepID=A0ABY2SID5_9HYPH|nr:LysR family transcriptional regulator [Martelella alba]TKI04587.1 LysR family transcriptional regulator [Martelella alba]
MDRFKEMQVFVRVAERHSFSQAAADLGIPRTTVTNLIRRLEQRLNVRLLERTTRQVRMTHEGEAFYHRCVRLLTELEDTENAFRGGPPHGLVRVNVQGTLAKHFVMPALGQFLQSYPDISLQIAEDDRMVDLVREGIDCVLRAGVLQDSTLTGRQIALMEQVTVASPAYLRKYGVPETPEDLRGHFAVNYIASPSGQALGLEFNVGRKLTTFRLETKISVTGADLYTGAALAGLGLIQVPRYRIAHALKTDLLRILLPQNPPPFMPVSILYPQSRHLSGRVRVFTQWLARQFAEKT